MTKKNYVGFGNDYSGSMASLRKAAKDDYNANINATKNAASREMLDTIVYMVGFGDRVERLVVNSNPHVLHPLSVWRTDGGGTPLYDSIGDLIDQMQAVPDYNNPDVSFLVVVTTDGGENSSRKYSQRTLAQKIAEVNRDGRWTIVVRVPKGHAYRMEGLGIPTGNIQEWDTTTAGMEKSTVATTAAMDTYYAERASGKKSSGTFYANATNVSAAAVKAVLVDISTEVSMWTVLGTEDGNEIKPFAEKRLGGMPFLKGAAFYQLTKTEARVQDNKMIVIRDKKSGHVYEGAAARQMIGLPTVGTCRLHPGDHGGYDIFIQSTSINRKLVAGTQVLYWPKVGTGFSAKDFPWLNAPQKNANPALNAAAAQAIQATAGIAPVVSPKPTNKPTPSPLKKAPAKGNVDMVNGKLVKFYDSRAEARQHGKAQDAGRYEPNGKRWFVYV